MNPPDPALVPIEEEETFTTPSTQVVEAERAVLGALLNAEDASSKLGKLQPSDFTLGEHQLIFDAFRDLEQDGATVDRVSMDARVRRHKDYASYPNLDDYLFRLDEESFGSERLEDYARIVLEYSIQRKLKKACSAITYMANNPEGRTPTEVIDEAEAKIREISDASTEGSSDLISLSSASWDAMGKLEKLRKHRETHKGFCVIGTPTGFPTFDRKTSGLQEGELVILAASPGMGKTSLALNIALHVTRSDTPGSPDEGVAAVFSMEMSASQLAQRMFAVLCEVDLKNLTTANLSDIEINRVSSAYERMKNYKIFIQESSAASPSLIRRMCQRIKHREGRLDLIVVDYLQLIRSDTRDPENRNMELAHITRELKNIALDLEAPVLCLSQLNRLGSKRDAGDAPRLQELRDSGAIEQDADMVMFLYKEAGQDEEGADRSDYLSVTLEVAKNRNGPTFRSPLIFSRPFTLFRESGGVDYEGEYSGDVAARAEEPMPHPKG